MCSQRMRGEARRPVSARVTDRRRRGRPRTKLAAGSSIALYGWVNGSLAAGVAHLDERLGLGATLVGVHLAAFAVGLLVTGALPTAERLVRIAPLVFGTTLVWFLAAPHPVISVVACAVLGSSGSLTIARGQTLLADPLVSVDPGRSLMTVNVIAAGTAAVAAAAVGAIESSLIVATTLPAILLGTVALGMRESDRGADVVTPSSGPTSNRPRARRSVAEYAGLALIASYVAIELTVANQLTGFLVAVGASTNVSSTAVGVMFAGIMLGRILVAASGTTRVSAVTIGAALTTSIALAVVTTAPSDPVILATVLVLGIALGPLYPLLIARILAASTTPARTSALATSAVGTALLIAPPSAGAARDVLGDRAGMAMLTGLAAIGLALAVVFPRLIRSGPTNDLAAPP